MVCLFLVIILNVHKWEFAYVDGGKLFGIAIENVKVIQNSKILELKIIIKLRGGFRVQNKVMTNFYKTDTIYIKVIVLIFVVIVVIIIIIVNVAILFCFEILMVTA